MGRRSPSPLSAFGQSTIRAPGPTTPWLVLGLLWATLAAVTTRPGVNTRPPASGRPGPALGPLEPRPTPALLALDPGSAETGWALLGADGRHVIATGTAPNQAVAEWLRRGVVDRTGIDVPDLVVVEWTAPRGMPASAQLFETMWWAGRFAQAAVDRGAPEPARLERAHVKRALCGTSAAKDANVRAALIDRYGGAGGKAAAIGLKASPGPLFGVSGDGWAALAVGVAWLDGAR